MIWIEKRETLASASKYLTSQAVWPKGFPVIASGRRRAVRSMVELLNAPHKWRTGNAWAGAFELLPLYAIHCV